jgi:tRNA G18 (ribose-2'-O)-methylase SpoU
VYVSSQACLNAIAGFDVHRGCLGIADRTPAAELDELLSQTSRVVVAEAIANPDNVGSVFRNAAAFGAGGVLLSPGCADPLYAKAIRTSAAATLQVPFAMAEPWPDALARIRRSGFVLVGLTPDPRAVILDAALPRLRGRRVALLIGSVNQGLTDGARAAADLLVRIPMAAGVDSLNLAVATGIVLSRMFEASPEG